MREPSVEQKVSFLRRVPLLQGFDQRLLELLVGMMKLERVSAGTVLCEQGKVGDACFIIGHGQVEIINEQGNEEQVLAVLGPFHVVGEVALIDGGKRSATVRCKTDVSVFTLQRDYFERLLWAGNNASMRLLDSVAQALAHRVREVNERYAEIFSKPGQTMSKLTEQLNTLRASVEADATEDVDDEQDLLAILGYKGAPSGGTVG